MSDKGLSDEPAIEPARRQTARRRRPPPKLPIVRELPAPEPPPVPLTVPVYFARFLQPPVALEIGTDEDWTYLARDMDAVEVGCQPLRFEVWVTFTEMSLRLWPHEDPQRWKLVQRKIENARPPPSLDDDFSPAHPGYSIRQAREDAETVYKRAMGQLPGPPGVEGPVVRNKRPVIRAGPLDEENRAAIKAIFGIDLPRPDPYGDVT